MFTQPFDPFIAMQTVSMLMMVVIIGVRVLPPLRPHARFISIATLVIYFVAITIFFVIGFLL